jgi:hypothetical protein
VSGAVHFQPTVPRAPVLSDRGARIVHYVEYLSHAPVQGWALYSFFDTAAKAYQVAARLQGEGHYARVRPVLYEFGRFNEPPHEISRPASAAAGSGHPVDLEV